MTQNGSVSYLPILDEKKKRTLRVLFGCERVKRAARQSCRNIPGIPQSAGKLNAISLRKLSMRYRHPSEMRAQVRSRGHPGAHVE